MCWKTPSLFTTSYPSPAGKKKNTCESNNRDWRFIPIPSMYGIFTNMWLFLVVTHGCYVGKYTSPLDADWDIDSSIPFETPKLRSTEMLRNNCSMGPIHSSNGPKGSGREVPQLEASTRGAACWVGSAQTKNGWLLKLNFGWHDILVGGWTNPSEKNARQIWSFPHVGVNIENIWNHHLVYIYTWGMSPGLI